MTQVNENITYKRKRRAFARSLGQCVEPVTKPVMVKQGLLEARLMRDWKTIVDAQTAQHTAPQKVRFAPGQTRDGTLHMLATTGYALRIQYQTPQLIERLAVYFGYKAITRIQVQQVHALPAHEYVSKPVTYQPLRSLPPVSDAEDSLQDALASLQRAMQQTGKKTG